MASLVKLLLAINGVCLFRQRMGAVDAGEPASMGQLPLTTGLGSVEARQVQELEQAAWVQRVAPRAPAQLQQP